MNIDAETEAWLDKVNAAQIEFLAVEHQFKLSEEAVKKRRQAADDATEASSLVCDHLEEVRDKYRRLLSEKPAPTT